jgi:hypothetical protein
VRSNGAEPVSVAMEVAGLTQRLVTLAPIQEVSATQERAEDSATHADTDTQMTIAQPADPEKLPDAQPADSADPHEVRSAPQFHCMQLTPLMLENGQHTCLVMGLLFRFMHIRCSLAA